MHKYLVLLLTCGLLGAGYYLFRMDAQNALVAKQLSDQAEQIQRLKQDIDKRQAAGQATVDQAEHDLTMTRQQLVVAKASAAATKAKLQDARDKLSVDGNRSDAKDDRAALSRDLAALLARLNQAKAAEDKAKAEHRAKSADQAARRQGGREALDRSAMEHRQMVQQIRSRQRELAAQRSDAAVRAERQRLQLQLQGEENALEQLRIQRQQLQQAWSERTAQEQQTSNGQLEELAADRAALQEQYDEAKKRLGELEKDDSGREALLSGDKQALRQLEDQVQVEEGLVKKLEQEIAGQSHHLDELKHQQP